MCDYSGKLVAWLDRELVHDEMAEVERHLRDCVECQRQVETYQQVSGSFEVYCDMVMTGTIRRRLPRWVPVLSTAAVAAMAAAVLLVFLRAPAAPIVLLPPVKAVSPTIVVETPPAPPKAAQRWHPAPPVQTQTVHWLPAQPTVQIAIPADAMFPPGALPEGVNFTADLSIAPDGSAQQIRLRPRLIAFERRTTQP